LCWLFIYLVILGFDFRASHFLGRHSTWVIPPALFCIGCFQDRVSWTICQGWLWTVVLLISASWVARLQVWATSAQLCWLF
jgi:hypothetical protein